MVQDFGVDWGRAQDALRTEVSRVTALLRSVRNPGAPAVGEWNLAELAMHLSQVWLAVPGLARRDLSRVYEVLPAWAGTAGESLIGDLWDLGGLTMDGVRGDPERDPRVLADRIEARAEEFFAECAGRSADEPHPWLVQGVAVPLCTLTCHLLNETVMHGGDLARADGRPWPVEPSHAAMVVLGFLVPILAALDPRALVVPQKAAGVRATYDVRVRGAGAFHLLFEDGALQVALPAARRVDCHISADPVALLHVMWGRESQWKVVATGKLLAWGRRPWLGPRLRTMIRNP
jgi:hypothetical protein